MAPLRCKDYPRTIAKEFFICENVSVPFLKVMCPWIVQHLSGAGCCTAVSIYFQLYLCIRVCVFNIGSFYADQMYWTTCNKEDQEQKWNPADITMVCSASEYF